MAEDFEAFLSQALTPPSAEADREFVRRVQTQIKIGDLLHAERRRLFATLCKQVAGIAAVAAGAWLISRSPFVADFAGAFPEVLLLALVAAFGLIVLLFGSYVPDDVRMNRTSSR